MKVVVFGYHNIGHVCLQELIAQGHEVLAVVTHQDDPDEEIWFSSVPELARELGLPTYTPENPNQPEFVQLIHDLRPDFLFSFYYRHMLKPDLLAIPMRSQATARGALNLHGSYLPRYRGRCPVNWVLVNGETETGVTLHYMVTKPDAGDIVAQRLVPIAFEDTALTLYHKLTVAAREMFSEALPALAAGTAPRIPQDPSQASYFGGRRPADGHFDWSQPALQIYNLVRAVTHPYPGAFTELAGDKLLVWQCRPGEPLAHGSSPTQVVPGAVRALLAEGPVVATGEGNLLLTSLQLGDGPEVSGSEFAHDRGLVVGDRLTAK